jgi:hypothetical protein
VYDIEENDTPEIVAEKVYGDAGGAWLVLMTNNILDPQFDWPLDYTSFNQFIEVKYGSIETALITPHHFEKVIIRRNNRTNTESVTRFIVNEERLTENMPENIPFSYYKPWTTTTYRTADSTFFNADNESIDLLADLDNGEEFGATLDRGNLALTGDYTPSTTYIINGEPIEIITKGEQVNCYEYEKRLNDDKRSIKIIKKEYYIQIQDELKSMTSNRPTYIRRVL